MPKYSNYGYYIEEDCSIDLSDTNDEDNNEKKVKTNEKNKKKKKK